MGKFVCASLAQCLRSRVTNLLQSELQLSGGGFDVLTLSQIIGELVAAKRLSNKREEYVRSLKYYLDAFALGFVGKSVDEIDFHQIEQRLSEIAGEQSGNSRQTWFNRVNTLFSYAKRRGIIASNPMERIERITVDRKEPVVLTVEQSKLLVKSCPSVCRPYLILALYAGIRPGGELMRLRWEHINLEAKTVTVNFPKVRKHRRIVHLEPIAVELLDRCPVKTGSVAPSASTVRRWKRQARALLGLKKWPQDCLRHTAASYLLALQKDAARVALELGNSPNILLTHYVVPVTKENCEQFWTI